jgi:hypothetical protein
MVRKITSPDKQSESGNIKITRGDFGKDNPML